MKLSIDFESKSTVDLKRSGAYVYARHPKSDVICLAWAFDDEEPEVWVPGQPLPERVIDYVQQPDAEIRGWNVAFERLIWHEIMAPRYGAPPVPLERWVCTAAEAANLSLPRSLDKAAAALGVEHQKDDAGHRLMLRMSKPRRWQGGEPVWWDDPGRLKQLYEYCKQDVRAERAVSKCLRPLSKRERAVYLLDQKINDRGMQLDQKSVSLAQITAHAAAQDANERLYKLTGEAVSAVTEVAKLRSWIESRGTRLPNLTKASVEIALRLPDLPDNVREALEIRQQHGRTSLAKLAAMKDAACSDSRVRGMLMYYGASRTGRWSGRLVQPQNLPRSDVNGADLRSMFTASPGHRLMVGDFDQIEARILGWLAGEPFRDQEYERMTAAIFRLPIEQCTSAADKEKYTVGKSAVLGCGYGMGSKRFAVQTGVDPILASRAVDTYRDAKKGVPRLWRELENAAIAAVKSPGTVHFAGTNASIRYAVRGGYLVCTLPSGRSLFYAGPALDADGRLECSEMDGYTHKWCRQSYWGGMLAGHVTQATARDVLVGGMFRLERSGYPIVLLVHDEIVCDVLNSHGSAQEFLRILGQPVSWLPGCTIPVNKNGTENPEMQQYGKA